jgi:cytochrome P460
MRIRLPGLTLAVLTALILASCDRRVPEPDLPALSADSISAKVLWDRFTVESDYTDYGFWPGHTGVNPGQSPHGVFHRIYVNRTLLAALPIARLSAPDGALIVKDNLNAARQLDSITVMAKIDGYDPENGNWYWAKYEPDGTVQVAGALSGCITCHEGVAANDYVILRRLDEPTAE